MTTRWIQPISDGEIIRNLKKLRKLYPEITGQFQATSFSIDVSALDGDISKLVLKANGFACNHFGINYGQLNFAYNGNISDKATNLVTVSDSINTSAPAQTKQTELLLDFFKIFALPPRGSPEPNGEEIIAAKFLRIESALTGAVERFEDLQASFAEKNQQLRDEHEDAVKVLKEQISEEKKVLQGENQKKRDEIELIRKELDDRSNTHARRAIRNEIKSSITESLSKSVYASQTLTAKTFVRWAYIVAIILLCGLTVWATSVFSQTVANKDSLAVSIWISGGKATISTLSAIGLVLLYLKWEISWLNQQASFERVLSSTRVDIDRASWVAESLLEWNRESPQKEIPHELLLSFTRRLFDWDAKLEDNQSATDSLASAILGSASKLQIGPNGANIELDNKAIRKLDKA